LFGHDRDDVFHATALAMYANTHRDKNSFPVGTEYFDFYHDHDVKPEELEKKLDLIFGKPK